MIFRALALALGLLLGAATTADARMHAGPNMLTAGHRLQGAIALLDDGSLGSPAAAYSFRKLKSTYTGFAVKLRRTTGGTQDIGFLGFVPGLGSPIDAAAALVFCSATTCFIDTWYDQSGNARNYVQATAANQPAFVFACQNGLPCAQTTALTQVLATVATVPATMPMTFSIVGRLQGSTSECDWAYHFTANNRFFADAASSTWYLTNNSAFPGAVAANNAWHAGIGVMNGASTVIGIDAVETIGNVTGNAGTGTFGALYNGAATCQMTESIRWDGYGLTATERPALITNQRSFWGF